jgi:muramoyltetrapeptide carboxypeptidase
MLINFDRVSKDILLKLKNILFGALTSIEFPSHELNRKGTIKGEICGGNLSVLYSLLGSVSDLDTTDKILFIEDLDEYLYHVDRMMMAMKRAGKFSKIKGLIVGGMNDMKDNIIPFGKTAEEIISEYVNDLKVPVAYNFPSGHIENNNPIIFGKEVSLNVGANVKLNYI